MFLDYSLKTPQERNAYVKKLLEQTPHPSNTCLNNISNYLLFVTEKDTTIQQRKEEYPIETANRASTIDKRQVSLEQLLSSLDNGEDGLYSFINTNQNQFLDPQERLTPEDIANPLIAPLLTNIENYKSQLRATSSSKTKYALKTQIIQTYQEIYSIKASKFNMSRIPFSSSPLDRYTHIPEHITFDADGYPHSDALITLFRPDHVALLLKYYYPLKSQLEGQFYSDLYWIMDELDTLITQTIKPNPLYYDLLSLKLQHYSNEEINSHMRATYNVTHTDQYWSTLWKQRIPKLIAARAQENYILWYHTNVVKSEWKKCSKCGQIKLAHPLYFSRNGKKNKFYSICKKCRSKK